MAGKNLPIYIVYDPKIEDSSSLSKFLGIVLEKAKYPLKLINFITIDEYLQRVSQGRFPQCTICLNKSYSSVSLKIAEIIEEPTYKFFSRYYVNNEKQILVLGLIMDINEIFTNDNSKKNAWERLNLFLKNYNALTVTAIDSSLDNDVPEVIKSSEEVMKEEATKKASIVKEDVKPPKLQILDAIVPETKNEIPKGYDELLEFYRVTKDFLDKFQKIQKLSSAIEEIL